MRRFFDRLSIRGKLTLWFAACLALGLAAFGGGVYVAFGVYLLREVDRALDEEVAEVAAVVRRSPESNLRNRLAESFGEHGGYVTQVTDEAGRVVFISPPSDVPLLPDRAVPSRGYGWRTVEIAGRGTHRMAAERVAGPDGAYVVAVGDSLERLRQARSWLLFSLLGIGPVAIAASLAGGYWLSRRALAPVRRVTQTALAVTATDLHRRVPVSPARDEVGELAEAFNLMIARLESAFEEVRRFTADAAHELRTPLAVIRTGAEVALKSDGTESRCRRALTDQLAEIDRLTGLADQLLFLSREDSRSGAEESEPVRLDMLLEELCESLQPTAVSRSLDLRWEEAPPCVVSASPDRLRRLFLNLLDNALRYTPPNGSVEVRLERNGGWARVVVADDGTGIAPEHLPRVFDRFYRGDQSRNRRTGGSGLGLAICRSIVETLGGRITLQSQLDRGTTAEVWMPAEAGRPDEPATSAASLVAGKPGTF